jgi:site-specific DNA recombinase
MRVVALFRVSTEKQENEGASLAAQERRFDELAAAGLWTVVAKFRGQESAAKAASERAVLQQVLGCLREQRVDALWVYEQSRLTRADRLEAALLLRELAERHVSLVLASGEAKDLASIEGEMVFDIQRAVDRAEVRRIRERMMRGRKEKARQGKKTGGAAPLGYRNPPPGDPKRGVLQVVAEEAELVRRIFREIAAGAGLRSLAERLTAEGVPAPRGIRWGKTTIRRMLENRAYLGISANGVWRASADSSTFRLDVTHPEAILVEGAHEAIVSPAMWEAARAQLGGSSNGRPGMLTGFLWINGLRAGIDASRRSSYYRPADRQPGPWIPVETVNQAVWAGFANLFRDGTTVRRLFQAAHRVDLRDACASDLEALDRQKGKLEARLERLVEMRADGEISKADFAERSAAARRSLREVEEANRSARTRLEAATSGQVDRVLAGLRRLVSQNGLALEAKRRALRHLVESVRVEVAESRHRQERGAGGRFASSPGQRWKIQDAFLRLRPYPLLATTDFVCSQHPAPFLVQIIRDGRILEPAELDATLLEEAS